MSQQATPSDFFTVPEAEDTWTDLAASTVKFNVLTVSGYNSSGTPNTGNVRFRPKNGNGYITLTPESEYRVEAPQGTYYRGDQFEVYAEEEGDGVYAIYGAAVVYDGP